jgi:hypothetical protein
LEIGDTIILKDDYNVSISFGNVGIRIAGGTKGIVLQKEEGTNSISAGFYLNEYITVTAILDKDNFRVSP